MADPFICEVRIFPFNQPPKGWLPCQGQTLQIQQYQAMYSLLGTQYGGNGSTTFQLPDLRGRVPVQMNPAGGLNVGNQAGAEAVALTQPTVPTHTHALMANAAVGTTASPRSDILASAVDNTHLIYAPATVGQFVTLNADLLDPMGGGAAHPNMQPFQVVQFCIATTGIYPQRQ